MLNRIRFNTESDVFALLDHFTNTNLITSQMTEGELINVFKKHLISSYQGNTYLLSDIQEVSHNPRYSEYQKLLTLKPAKGLPKLLARIYKKKAFEFQIPECSITNSPIIFPAQRKDTKDLSELSFSIRRINEIEEYERSLNNSTYALGKYNKAIGDLYWLKHQQDLANLSREERISRIEKLKKILERAISLSNNKIDEVRKKLAEDQSRLNVFKESQNQSNMTNKEFRELTLHNYDVYTKKKRNAEITQNILQGTLITGVVGALSAASLPLLIFIPYLSPIAAFAVGISAVAAPVVAALGIATATKRFFSGFYNKVTTWFNNLGQEKIDKAQAKRNRCLKIIITDLKIHQQENIIEAYQTSKEEYSKRLEELNQVEQKYYWQDEFSEKSPPKLETRSFSPIRTTESIASQSGLYCRRSIPHPLATFDEFNDKKEMQVAPKKKV